DGDIGRALAQGRGVAPRGPRLDAGPERCRGTGHRSQRLDDLEAQPGGEPGDVVERLDQVRPARLPALVVGAVRDGHPAEGAPVRQALGHVEGPGDPLAPARLPGEGEVRDRGPGRVCDAGEFAQAGQAVAAPARAVHYEAI